MARLHVVRGRSAFAELARRGHRVREGPVTVTFLARTGDHRFSFAVSRRLGPAVARNRLRRRLRALLAEAVADPTLGLPEGDYLVRVAPTAVPLEFGELRTVLHRALGRTGAAA